MVIVRLYGGLGNQMFQYAAGRRLAYVLDSQLKLHISSFRHDNLRNYELSLFDIKESIATDDEALSLTAGKQGILKRLVARALGKTLEPAPTHIQERHFHFDPEVLTLPDNVYLDGYWQSAKYFEGIEDVIRKDFTIKTSQDENNKEISRQIESRKSVSLHIRRGDYISNAYTKRLHGTCDLEYYQRCVEEITRKVEDPNFYLFTDDPTWVRQNLKFIYPAMVIDHNGSAKSYEDLRLMSQCKHHIIANSTFSWWAAWLSNNSNKTVCAPKRWFANDNLNIKDLLPETWLKI
jgi:hypothetical protein